MKFINYFSHAAEKIFARELAHNLSKEIPPVLMENRRKVLSVNKITKLLERTYLSAAEYQHKNKMGFIKRAVFANTFKWELKLAKYPEDFIDVATEGLIVNLSKKS